MRRTAAMLMILGFLGAPDRALPAVAGREHVCLNGVTAVLHGAEELSAYHLVTEQGRTFLHHDRGDRIELATGPDDPRVGRTTDAFHPFDPAVVLDALARMRRISGGVRVEVFILPVPPLDPPGSYSEHGVIYLSPGFAPVSDATVHYIVTHEMGHVLTACYLDGAPERWEAYRRLRGLPPVDAAGVPAAELPHRERPREIIAEDIRFLYGSDLARSSGTIENPSLPLPGEIAGLSELLESFFLRAPADHSLQLPSRAYPNPCNPLTHVELELPQDHALLGDQAVLRLYDVRGRMVRVLLGGETVGGRLQIRWQGDNSDGSAAASGTYLYVLTLGRLVSRGSVVLVR
ncbi:MAG: hypothetical protein R6X25_08200 [Candidatus Krumholzibacteriia bacterium]